MKATANFLTLWNVNKEMLSEMLPTFTEKHHTSATDVRTRGHCHCQRPCHFFLLSCRHTWRISRKAIKIPVIVWILHHNRPHLLYELQSQLLSQRRWWGRLPHNTASAPFVLSLILGTTRLEKSPSLVTCPCSPTQQAPLQRSTSWFRLFNIAFGLQKNVSNVWTAVLMPSRIQGLRLL